MVNIRCCKGTTALPKLDQLFKPSINVGYRFSLQVGIKALRIVKKKVVINMVSSISFLVGEIAGRERS